MTSLPEHPRLAELRSIAEAAGTPDHLRVLEWGTGASTAVLADVAGRRRSGLVVTIDHHPSYQRAELEKIPCRHLVRAVSIDLEGPLTTDLHPDAQRENYGTWPLANCYSPQGWDLIVVDGRRRLECLLVAATIASDETLVVLHDYRRFRYQAATHVYDVLHDGPEYRIMRAKKL